MGVEHLLYVIESGLHSGRLPHCLCLTECAYTKRNQSTARATGEFISRIIANSDGVNSLSLKFMIAFASLAAMPAQSCPTHCDLPCMVHLQIYKCQACLSARSPWIPMLENSRVLPFGWPRGDQAERAYPRQEEAGPGLGAGLAAGRGAAAIPQGRKCPLARPKKTGCVTLIHFSYNPVMVEDIARCAGIPVAPEESFDVGSGYA
jgi:hypothetical protein